MIMLTSAGHGDALVARLQSHAGLRFSIE